MSIRNGLFAVGMAASLAAASAVSADETVPEKQAAVSERPAPKSERRIRGVNMYRAENGKYVNVAVVDQFTRADNQRKQVKVTSSTGH